MIEAARTELKFPIILKDNYGSHGANNFLIENKADLENKLKENSNVELILQTYHQNDCDYRVLVMGEREPLVIKRTAISGSHLNNTSQGAKAELGHLPNDLLEQSKSLAKHLKMSVAGVDLLEDKNTHETFFLEVNSQPQLLTGAFVVDKKQAFTSLIKDLI
jgi:glutathione synthase/RimK-type ligase-like ATP-grasp enzyme